MTARGRSRRRLDIAAVQEELRIRREEQRRLERELTDTNRGVVALYADLEDKAERLRRADEAKTSFLSGVSHELRTPLNSILALSKLLLERTDGPLTPEQEKQVGFIRKSADDLLALVNNLLDLSRIEAGRTPVDVSEFSLADVFTHLDGEMRPLLRGPDVSLVFEEPPAVLLSTDRQKLTQIVRNLVSNAIKYTERGSVTVSARTLGDRIVMSVADTGIGIAQEDQERVFDEFMQVPGPLQTATRGSGLGLPLCRALAVVLGGKVGLQSEIGTGSVFTVEVPIRHASVAQSSATPSAGRGTVLVVDDDQVSRYVVSQMLRSDGHTPIEATGGLDGIARARDELPDLVVLDLSMPDLDGVEVLQRLREDAATADIPVVVYSARELSAGERGRLAGQAAAIVTKADAASDELRDAVRLFMPARAAAAAAGRPGQ